MRLIDADRIVYSWHIDADGEEHDGVTLQSIIKKMPTIDAVEVVRCKDCKYFEEDLYKGLFEGDGVCFHEHWVLEDTGFEVKETDYCSYGERREE